MAREVLGIDKKSLMEDYYPDETFLLLRRKGIMDKRRDERSKNTDNEPVEEVGYEDFFGRG
jgi:hypothetical protein